MKTIAKYIVAALIAAAVTVPTLAMAAPRMGVPARLNRQHARIHAGIMNHTLTRRQARALYRRDEAIHLRGLMYRSHDHGRLTPAERARLETRLNRTSHAISHQKH